MLADRTLDDGLRHLGSYLCRETRRATPAALPMFRMAQSIAIWTYLKAESTDPDLVTLNRTLSELNRSLRTLGIRVPEGGRGRLPRKQVPVPGRWDLDDEGDTAA